MIDRLPAEKVLTALLAALDSAGLGCSVVVDRGDRFERVYANQPFADIMGVDLESARTLPPTTLVSPEERERLVSPRPAGDLGIETTLIRPDGTPVPVEAGLATVPLEEAQAVLMVLRDLSELKESEQRFRSLAESSPDSITVYCEDRYVYANPVALGHLGISSLEELADVDPDGRVAPESRELVLEHASRAAAGETLPPLIHRVPQPGGGEKVLETSLSHTTISGKPAIVSYTRDITERVALRAELMRQDRLAAVGTLAAGVAHELNNLLMSLGPQARRLRQDASRHGFSEDVRFALDQMGEAAARMEAILADLSFAARPAERPQAHVDVGEVLKSTVALVRAGTPDCPSIRLELEPLPPIRAFASKLGQVFLNLLRNAAQAVEQRADGEIVVRCWTTSDLLEVQVADNGVGIPPDVLPRVGEPFFTTKPHGTGLGLWISRSLVADHGGQLIVKSVPERGTTVTLSLPK